MGTEIDVIRFEPCLLAQKHFPKVVLTQCLTKLTLLSARKYELCAFRLIRLFAVQLSNISVVLTKLQDVNEFVIWNALERSGHVLIGGYYPAFSLRDWATREKLQSGHYFSAQARTRHQLNLLYVPPRYPSKYLDWFKKCATKAKTNTEKKMRMHNLHAIHIR
jgi:hypothetical protein